jgi:hypothetical protein
MAGMKWRGEKKLLSFFSHQLLQATTLVLLHLNSMGELTLPKLECRLPKTNFRIRGAALETMSINASMQGQNFGW